MTVCPKCKKQELEGSEEVCPRCANKEDSYIVKVIAIVAPLVTAGLFAIFRGKGGNSA